MASLTVISSAISATSDAFCSSCELTTSSSYSSAAYFSNRKVIFYNGERSFRGCALRKKYVSAVASTFSQPAKALVPEKSVSVILLAGGKGKRMGASIPKQYLPLLGQPIVLYSFHTLSDVAEVKEIIVACDPSYQKLFEDASSNLVPVLKFASPGEERQDSVFNGLKEVDDAAELVCVHDSARPLVSSESVKQVLQDAWVHGAAVLGVPVKATIKEASSDGFVVKTLKRETLWEMQTPQVMKTSLLRKGFEIVNRHYTPKPKKKGKK